MKRRLEPSSKFKRERGLAIVARLAVTPSFARASTIESEVFVGHGVTFINDRYPRATSANGQLQTEADWNCQSTIVKRGASIGSGATLLGGITDRRKRHRRRGQCRDQGCSAKYHCGGQSCANLENLLQQNLPMRVPFLDLNSTHAPLRGEIDAAIEEVIDSGASPAGHSSRNSKRTSQPTAVAGMPSASEAARMRSGWHCWHSGSGRETK